MMTTHARTLIHEVRGHLREVEEKIREHPYLRAAEAGRLRPEDLVRFAEQQRHIITSDLRSIALMVARASSEETRAFFLNALAGERAALEALGSFAKALGIAPETFRAADPLPGAYAYSAFVASMALFGSPAEFAGAFLVNLEAWGANCGRLAEALTAHHGLNPDDVAFFTLFATPPPSFAESAFAVVEEGLAIGVEPRAIRRAATLLQGYELLYWDTLMEISEGR
ncbi:MAG: transcriptional regulator [Candidatus Methylomirabilales bacterium]